MSVVLPSTTTRKRRDYVPAVRHKRVSEQKRGSQTRSIGRGKTTQKTRQTSQQEAKSASIPSASPSIETEVSEDSRKLLQKDSLYEYSTKHEICLDILCDGCVQSFVEFFYLTHRSMSGADQGESDTNVPGIRPSVNEAAAKKAKNAEATGNGESFVDDMAAMPVNGLKKVAQHLRDAEAARRAGEAGGVFDSYVELGTYFESLKDYDTSTYFHKKCVLLAQETGDMAHEWQANNSLGQNAEELGDLVQAIEYYERCLAIVKTEQHNDEDDSKAIVDRLQATQSRLVAAYQRFADQCTVNNDHTEATRFFRKGLEVAQAIHDEHAEAEANYRLGLEAEALKDTEQAVEYYTRYLVLCRSIGDTEGEQSACSMLARAHSSSGDLEKSAEFLEERRKLALKTNNSEAEAAACRDLGIIANQRHDFESAAQFFSNAFEISQKISMPSSDIDRTRVGLGIARGSERLEEYIDAALSCSDSVKWYKWKIEIDGTM